MIMRWRIQAAHARSVDRMVFILSALVVSATLGLSVCRDRKASSSETTQTSAGGAPHPSGVAITVKPGGPAVITTSAAEFDVLPSGYVQPFLLKDGRRLTLDEPDSGNLVHSDSGDSIFSDRWEIRDLAPVGQPEVSEAQGKIGPRGKRVRLTFRSNQGIEKDFAEYSSSWRRWARSFEESKSK